MEGYKCPKCYKIGLTTSFISNHFCYIQPIKPQILKPKYSIEITKDLLIKPETPNNDSER